MKTLLLPEVVFDPGAGQARKEYSRPDHSRMPMSLFTRVPIPAGEAVREIPEGA